MSFHGSFLNSMLLMTVVTLLTLQCLGQPVTTFTDATGSPYTSNIPSRVRKLDVTCAGSNGWEEGFVPTSYIECSLYT